jgi:hypothetical protein
LLRPLALASILVAIAAALLTGCESTPAVASAASAAAPASDKPRCEKREVTGSRLARCDSDRVGIISGEEVRAHGMPSSGPARSERGAQP